MFGCFLVVCFCGCYWLWILVDLGFVNNLWVLGFSVNSWVLSFVQLLLFGLCGFRVI